MSMRLLLIVLCLSLSMVACKKQSTPPEGKYNITDAEAKADCMQQSQSMFNATIDPHAASENSYYSNCMQAKYGFSLEKIKSLD